MDLADVTRTNRALVKVAKLYRATQAAYLAPLGLHPGQDVLLWILASKPDGVTASDLANRLGVEPPTVTRSLARLDGQGWFTRQSVPGDRRMVRLVPTARATATAADVERVWVQLATTATAGLKAKERDQLVALLERVQQALVDEVGYEPLAED